MENGVPQFELVYPVILIREWFLSIIWQYFCYFFAKFMKHDLLGLPSIFNVGDCFLPLTE